MAVEVMVPRFGWSMDRGVFGEWLKQDGDPVAPGDSLFSIEADKAAEEVESEAEGVLRMLPGVAQSGEEIQVGTVIGWIVAEGESIPDPRSVSTEVRAQPASDDDPHAVVPPPAAQERPGRPDSVETQKGHGSRSHPDRIGESQGRPGAERRTAISSPRARRVARELGVDWRRATGSGKQGRVIDRDVYALAGELLEEGSGSCSTTTLRVDADLSELIVLLDRLVESVEGLERTYLYRALLVRLTVVAYRLTLGREKPAETPRVLIGLTEGRGISFVPLDGTNLNSGTTIADRIKILERSERSPTDGDRVSGASGDCLEIVDLGELGIDEYTPSGHSHCPRLCFGRIRAGSSAGEHLSDRDLVRIAFSYGPGAVDLVPGAAAFLQKVCAAVERPLPFLAL